MPSPRELQTKAHARFDERHRDEMNIRSTKGGFFKGPQGEPRKILCTKCQREIHSTYTRIGDHTYCKDCF